MRPPAPEGSLPPPKQDSFTEQQLARYNGEIEDEPIYLSCMGVIFDVSGNPDNYGLGKSYNILTGKDASVALAKSSLKPEDMHDNVEELSEDDKKTLLQWFTFFEKRYPKVGILSKNKI